MSRKNSTVKIVDGKVVFSQEVLNYFENLRTVENSEWIDKYFEVLSKKENINSLKYEIHHIISCFMIKEKYNKNNRSDVSSLADKIEGNLIKLSIQNHIKAHYCLWKILKTTDAKLPISVLCGNVNIENLTEEDVEYIGKIQEECKQSNKTDEEIREYNNQYNASHKKEQKEWKENHKEEQKAYKKKWHEDNKEEIKKKKKIYREKNKERIRDHDKKYYEENKDEIKERESQLCYDPIANNKCKLGALRQRKHNHKEDYKNINPSECIIKS